MLITGDIEPAHMQERTGQALGPNAVATLKHIALMDGLDGPKKLSCAGLAERLEASTQTASRRLQRLEDADLIERELVSDGQLVSLTDDGMRRLETEYAQYRRIFEAEEGIELLGSVTSGMGEGRHYITLPGYMEQFREKLGYEPYAGTLNIDLAEDSARRRGQLSAAQPIVIEGWEDEERTYGPAYCYSARLSTDDESYEPAHVITPERTHHGEDQLELIAPAKLREVLGLEDGDEVTTHVKER